MRLNVTTACGLALLCVSLTAAAQDYADPPDLPYTAIVTDESARFVFPVPSRQEWTFGGPAPADVIEFEWAVELENGGPRYALSVAVWKRPGYAVETSKVPPPFAAGDADAFRIDASGRRTRIESRFTAVHVFAAMRQGETDYTRLAIEIRDPQLLRQFFDHRPAVVTFTERYPGNPVPSREVVVDYSRFHLEPALTPRTPTWTRVVRGSIAEAAVAPSGNCVAIQNDRTVEIITRAGERLWAWDYLAFNRWLKGPQPLAVAPSCDVIAFGGGSGYPYTWIVHRTGRKTLLKVSPVPRSLAFDRESRLLAVGTGLAPVYLFTISGTQVWKRDISGHYVGGLEFSENNQYIVVTSSYGVAAIRRDGTVLWQGNDTRVVRYTPNLSTFLTHFETTHGEYHPVATLYGNGPAARKLWSIEGEGCTMNRNGGKIVARSDGLKVFSQDGATISTLPDALGCPIAFTADEQRLVTLKGLDLEEVDLEGRRFWAIPLTLTNFDFPIYSWSDGLLAGILVRRGDPQEGRIQLDFYDLR